MNERLGKYGLIINSSISPFLQTTLKGMDVNDYHTDQCMSSDLRGELAGVTTLVSDRDDIVSLGNTGAPGFRDRQQRDFYNILLQPVNRAYNVRLIENNLPTQRGISK